MLTEEEKNKIAEEEKIRLKAKQDEEFKQGGIGCLSLIGIIVLISVFSSLHCDRDDEKINYANSTSQTETTIEPSEEPETTPETTEESGEQTDEERYEASRNAEIGDTCVLNGGGSMNIIGTNYEDLKAIDKAAMAGDKYAVVEMYYQGRAFAVPSGTKVLFIDSSWAGRKIRILEGNYAGKSGWVSRDYIQPIK